MSCSLGHHFQLEVFPLLKPLSAAPREVIYSKGAQSYLLFFMINQIFKYMVYPLQTFQSLEMF